MEIDAKGESVNDFGEVNDHPRLKHRLDYEDCRGWYFDVVAVAPNGKTAVCQFRIYPNNKVRCTVAQVSASSGSTPTTR